MFDLLSEAKDSGKKVHKHTIVNFLTAFLHQLSPDTIEKLSAWSEEMETSKYEKEQM